MSRPLAAYSRSAFVETRVSSENCPMVTRFSMTQRACGLPYGPGQVAGRMQADRHAEDVRVRPRKPRDDRRVGDVEPVDAEHVEAGADDGTERARADGVRVPGD